MVERLFVIDLDKHLLLKVLPDLIIHFEFVFKLFKLFLVNIPVLEGAFRRGDGWTKKVEE